MSNVTDLAPKRQDLFTLAPRNLAEAMEYAKLIADTDMVPKDFKGKPGNVLVAIQMGAEIGLPPTQALQNIAVINGRPSLWGDAVLALVTASAECIDVLETDDGHTATCTIKRRNKSDVVRTFSMDDAKLAGLAGKPGPWTQYPARMRQMRARSFAVRDAFPHLLRGISIAEEVMDVPSEPRNITPQPTEPATLPSYPEEAFARNFPTWELAIKSGKKTADQIIATVQTKGILSEEMIKRIKACEAEDEAAEPQGEADWWEDYDNAEAAKGGQQ